jgi:ADP-heptose:LPS heptosyltransferase
VAGPSPLRHGRQPALAGSAAPLVGVRPELVPGPPGPLTRLDLRDVRRILVVRLDNIGDMVMLGPALRALRAAAPAATITLLASPAGSQAAALLPWLDGVVELRAVWQDASRRLPFDPDGERRVIDGLAAGHHDAAFIFTSFSQTAFPPAYACYLAGIPVRVGQTAEFGGAVLTHPVRPLDASTHQVERSLHLLEACGILVDDRALEVRIPDAASADATALLRDVGIGPERPYAVLAPGASCSARRFPADRFGAVAAELGRRTGWRLVVVGRAGEEALAKAIRDEAPEAVSLVGRTTVAALAAVVAGARLVVTSHSAALHLADATRVPVLCFFSGTDEESQWAPRSTPAALLRRETLCAPCRRFECPIGLPCLEIGVDDAVSAALALLDRSEVGVA